MRHVLSILKNHWGRLKDVSKVQVNFGTDTAHVEFDPKTVSLTELEKAVKTAGYDVVNHEVTIKIGGMVCATCVQTIETALRALPGIISANVNLGTEKAYVAFNPSISTIPEMKKAIEDAGYQYLGIAGEVSEEAEKIAREKDLHDKFLRFSIGFAVSIPLMIAMWVPLPHFHAHPCVYNAGYLRTGILLCCLSHFPCCIHGAAEPLAQYGCDVCNGYRCCICCECYGNLRYHSHP